MSSIKTLFEKAQRILNDLEEGTLEDVQEYCIEPIEYLLNITRGQNVSVRCCNTKYTGEDEQKWIRCDSYDLPRDEFAKQCAQCAEEIELGLPKLKELYQSKL